MGRQTPPPPSAPRLLDKVTGLVRRAWGPATPEAPDAAAARPPPQGATLAEALERRQRNDAIRRHEFGHLRALRRQGGASASTSDEPLARSSFLDHQPAPPHERAHTLRKIDEIEAQIAQQWWRATPAPAPLQALPERPHSDDSGYDRAFAPTAPLSLLDGLPGQAAPRVPAGSGGRPREGGGPAAPSAAAPSLPATPAEVLQDPDLDEPALLFARGEDAAAEAALHRLMAERAGSEPEARRLPWLALFDFYRATDRQASFEALAVEYQAHLGGAGPRWPPLAHPQPRADAATWEAAPLLGPRSVAALQEAVERSERPRATLDWAPLMAIDLEAAPALAALFERWAGQTVDLRFRDLPALRTVLRAQTPSGDRQVDPQWWRLHMALLRLLDRAEEYEFVALDYGVTYEVPAPPWAPPRCRCREEEEATPGAAALHAAGGSRAPALEGSLEGDISAVLARLAPQLASDGPATVACDRLSRVDFPAAGALLRWAMGRPEGQVLRLTGLNRLVAAFLHLVGLGEWAELQLREP